MQIEITITMDDYLAFQRRFLEKSSVMRLVFWFGLVVPTVLIAAIGVVLGWLENTIVATVVFWIGAGLWALLFPPLHRALLDVLMRVIANSRNLKGILGPVTLILAEESLTEITAVGKTEVLWKNMHEVDSTADHTFIFLTGLSAVILPRRGCARMTDYELARDFALAHVGPRPRDA